MTLVHHELCFGCGRTNLFGLLLDLEERAKGTVSGRCFIKQDHQGPDRGCAHDGLIAAALVEAMALAGGSDARLARFATEVQGQARVGSFVDVEARTGPGGTVVAAATVEGDQVASATGTFKACRTA